MLNLYFNAQIQFTTKLWKYIHLMLFSEYQPQDVTGKCTQFQVPTNRLRVTLNSPNWRCLCAVTADLKYSENSSFF